MEAVPALSRRRIILLGFQVAFVSGGIVCFLGLMLITAFGLPAFASSWAGMVVVSALLLLVPNAFVFLPLASLLALIGSFVAVRRNATPYSGKAVAGVFFVAVLLLSMTTVPFTIYMFFQPQLEAREKAQQESVQQAFASIRRIGRLEAWRDGDAVLLQPALMSGDAAGLYRATVTVADLGKILVSETREMRLPDEEDALSFAIPFSAIRESYRSKLLEGNEPVGVESAFSFTYTLELLQAENAETERMVPGDSPERRSSLRSSLKIDLGTF